MARPIFKLFGMIGMKGLEKIEADLEGLDKEVRKVQRNMARMGRNVQKVGKQLSVGLTVPLVAATGALVKATMAASALSETISATGQIFGESAQQINKWSDTAATSFGQSKEQAMEAANTFAIFGKSAGLAGNDLVTFSTDFVKLASDFASFRNTTPEEAITAIGAALRGESEPIRRYGILLNDATLRQEALALGLIKTTKQALTPQQKVLAAQAAIYRQSSDAQGDFQRTSGELANQQRILKAEIADISASMGQTFLPIALDLMKVLRSLLTPVKQLVNWFNNLNPTVRKTGLIIAGVLAVAGPFLIVVGKIIVAAKALIPVIAALKIGFSVLNGVMAANPIGAVILGIVGLIAGLKLLYEKNEWFRNAFTEAWQSITYIVQQSASYIKRSFYIILSGALNLVSGVGKLIPGMTEKIDRARAALDRLQEKEKWTIVFRKQLRKATKDQTDANEELAKSMHETRGVLAQLNKDSYEQLGFKNKYVDLIKEEAEEEKKLTNTVKKETAKRKSARKEAAEQRQEQEISFREVFRSSINDLTSIFSMFSDNRMARTEQRYEREKALIIANTKDETLRTDKLAALDEKFDAEKRKIARRQAARNKAAALFNAGIGAVEMAISGFLTKPFLPTGLLMGAKATALGALKVAAIASKPVPELAAGALVPSTPGGVQAIIGEGREDEIVMPLKTGVDMLIEALSQKVNGLGAMGTPAFATAPVTYNLHVGTLVADDAGIKQLERKMRDFRIEEDQRRGA